MSATTGTRCTFVPADVGDAYRIIGERLTFKITNAISDNTFSMMVLEPGPNGGPPVHTHPSAEIFYVLDGQFKFLIVEDGVLQEVLAGPGDSVHIPGELPHAYQTVGDGPHKTVLFFTPGGDMERFFAELGTPDSEPETPLDFGKLLSVAATLNWTFPPEFLPGAAE